MSVSRVFFLEKHFARCTRYRSTFCFRKICNLLQRLWREETRRQSLRAAIFYSVRRAMHLPPSLAKTLSTAPEHPPHVISTLYSNTCTAQVNKQDAKNTRLKINSLKLCSRHVHIPPTWAISFGLLCCEYSTIGEQSYINYASAPVTKAFENNKNTACQLFTPSISIHSNAKLLSALCSLYDRVECQN